jgi:hypothetical protein
MLSSTSSCCPVVFLPHMGTLGRGLGKGGEGELSCISVQLLVGSAGFMLCRLSWLKSWILPRTSWQVLAFAHQLGGLVQACMLNCSFMRVEGVVSRASLACCANEGCGRSWGWGGWLSVLLSGVGLQETTWCTPCVEECDNHRGRLLVLQTTRRQQHSCKSVLSCTVCLRALLAV